MTAPAVARRWAGAPAPVSSPVVLSATLRRLAGLRRAAPLGAVLLTAVVVQVAVAPHLAVRGAAPEALLVAVAAVAAGRGPRVGAAFGFAAGFGADLFLATPLGTSALGFTLLGHLVGSRSRPPSSARVAGALCRPEAPCFACRAGRSHGGSEGAVPAATRLQRRAAARRALVRQSLGLTVVAVAGGRLATAAVATALAGAPFPPSAELRRILVAAAVSAPLGPPVFAVVRRLAGAVPGGGGR